jgi:hypothetical protein
MKVLMGSLDWDTMAKAKAVVADDSYFIECLDSQYVPL